MTIGPQRISKKVAKKAVVTPVSRGTGQSGLVTDKRPTSTESNLQRIVWGITNRQTKGDWING